MQMGDDLHRRWHPRQGVSYFESSGRALVPNTQFPARRKQLKVKVKMLVIVTVKATTARQVVCDHGWLLTPAYE